MSYEIIDVTHPARIRCVPHRGTNVRVVNMSLTTPVRLRRISESEPMLAAAMDVDQCPKSARFFGIEGKLWCEFGRHRVRPGKRAEIQGQVARPRTFEEAKAYLAEVTVANQHEIHPAFVDSPLNAGDADNIDRGTSFDIRQVRDMREDGRAAAIADVQRFFNERVVVAGDHLYVRCGDPGLALNIWGNRIYATAEPWPILAKTPFGSSFRADRADVAFALATRYAERSGRDYGDNFTGATQIRDRSYFTDDDVALLIRRLPKQVIGILGEFLPQVPDGLISEWMDLRRLADRAATGKVRLAEAPAVIDTLKDAMKRFADERGVDTMWRDRMSKVANAFDRFDTCERPRLMGLAADAEADVDIADEDAIAGFSPGP